MKYKIINNFLDKKQCLLLIDEAKKLSITDDIFKIHGGRLVLSCTSSSFNKLYNGSTVWKNLIIRITSKSFFSYCCKELDLNESDYKIVNFFNNYKLTRIDSSYKKLSNINVGILTNMQILKVFFYRVFKSFNKIMKINILFFNKKPIELLYDYSTALNGYSREIHRDSDNRLIVFLLYFNKISTEAEGGDLNVFELKNKDSKIFPPQPKIEDCNIIETVKPDYGKLLIFKNTDNSYHSVSEMKNNKITRHFLYGGFTLLSKKNPFIKSLTKFKTNFHLYY